MDFNIYTPGEAERRDLGATEASAVLETPVSFDLIVVDDIVASSRRGAANACVEAACRIESSPILTRVDTTSELINCPKNGKTCAAMVLQAARNAKTRLET